MNCATFSGRIGNDADVRYTPSGSAVCDVSIAVNKGKDKPPLWIKATFWGKLAESLGQYLTKGKMINVAGPVDLELWTNNQSGEPQGKITVTVREFSFGGGNGSENQQQSNPAPEQRQQPQYREISDEDIPF